jgi:hypothetical protein
VSHPGRGDPGLASLDDLIQQIIGRAQGDDEKLRAFERTLEDHVAVPCDGFVIGEPISLVGFGYDGHPRRGLTATCRRRDGTTHVVAACDVVLPPRSDGGRYLAAYRRWLGLEPDPAEPAVHTSPRRQHKATAIDIDLTRPVELVALSVKARAARCQIL